MSAQPASDSLNLTLFERNVKHTLRLYDQPERLGQESPLASPYMLALLLRDLLRPVTARTRGDLLRSAIYAAATRLWDGPPPANRAEMLEAISSVRRDPDDPRYSFLVLELRCFHTQITPRRLSDIWEDDQLLLGSRSQHYREFDIAVKHLAPLLLDTLRPTLRPEQPPPPALLYGYDRQITLLIEALQRGQTVALSGPGGIGKTSLAAVALDQLADRPGFWFTVRPGINDGVNSLLFALGAFLHEHDAVSLWQYLITTGGVINDLNLVIGLLRQDLAAIVPQPPVLCFDDLEQLTVGGLDAPTAPGAHLLDLIDALRGATPLLLISQRPLPTGDVHIDLTGLQPDTLMQICRDAGFPLDAKQAERLSAYTGGNPRLLLLLLSLQQQGAADLTAELDDETARSLQPALQRLWRRLQPDEQVALQRLAVYRGYAPEEVVEPAALQALSRLKLIEHDRAGGIALLPALAPVVRSELPAELSVSLHNEAAVTRLERGEYTAAAYHFVAGGDPERAVQIWFPQRQHALAHGEADSARQIFLRINRADLSPTARKAFDMLRAELRQYAGELEASLQDLKQADWSDVSEASARLWMFRGELEDALGYPDQALKSYGEGLRVAARLVGQITALYQRNGLLHLRRRDLQSSWQAVYRAEFELELLRGKLRDEEGDYDGALTAYTRARALADQLEDDALRAQAERWLATIYGRREQLAEAVQHATSAISIYERIGDRLNLEQMRSNLASIYVQTREFAAAIEVGLPAYTFFLAVKDLLYASGTAANLAEASYNLGDLAAAVHYASEVLEMKQPFTMPYARFTLGQVELRRTQIVAAASHFSAAMEQARQNKDHYLAIYAQRALGDAHLRAGDLRTADEHIHQALAAFRTLDIPSEIAETEALLATLETARAAGG